LGEKVSGGLRDVNAYAALSSTAQGAQQIEPAPTTASSAGNLRCFTTAARQIAPHLSRNILQAMRSDHIVRATYSGSSEMDESTRTELEAAAFRRLVAHLRNRTDVQNIDLMSLAGFCRNCLGDWYREAASEKGITLEKEQAREIIYGMTPSEWKRRYQREAKVEQQAHFEKSQSKTHS
jgi:uncharacterized protein